MDTCIIAHLSPLGKLLGAGPKTRLYVFFLPQHYFRPRACNHSRFLCVTTPLTIEVVSSGAYWVSTAGLPSDVSRRPFVHSEFLMRDTLIMKTRLRVIPSPHPYHPPPHYTQPLTFILYHLVRHCRHLIFSVVSSVHRFSSLILRLVLYVLISDSTTFLALHSTAKMKHTVKKTIRESQAGKCPNRNIEIQLESEAMRLDINRVLLSKNGWSDGGGSSSLCLKMARSTSPMIGTWEDYIKSGHACDINCVRPYRRGRGRQLGSSEFERDAKNVFLCASCRS